MDGSDDIARRLIAFRELKGLSQTEFAAKLHIAKNTLNGYETGSRPLTIETAKKIRKRFGVSLDWLLYGDIGQPSHEIAAELGPAPEIKNDAQKAAPVKKRRKAS